MKNAIKHQALKWWKDMVDKDKTIVINFYQVSTPQQMTTSQIISFYEKYNKKREITSE